MFPIRNVCRHLSLWGFGCLLLLGGQAFAQQADPDFLDMRDRLFKAASYFAQAGFRLSHELNVNTYGNGRYRDITLTLDGGREYAVVAVGDDNARDIDLQLYDQNGEFVGEDRGSEPVAMLRVRTNYRAPHTLRVIMSDCRARNCYAGVGVFTR